ncbi:MAG: AMP-binding protein [Flavobacteriales bacterium]|nr:AMP-binding protein [Flavobacteriales bacterium]MBK6943461.1 AMP-binding protein [Flavobacteriales bacterium]MBK9536002.1 AMP-binding protein [Flavobacteriales bacterium]MBP9139100.1 AMP-binding protein [Flavobacteriales bacterium]HQV52116.1 AMP-binding protein [Flavobacteriales bacterium]
MTPVRTVSALQDQELASMQAHVADLFQRSPWYKKVLHDAGVSPQDLRIWKDIQDLPFTTKEDLALHNERFLCVPMNKIVDHVFTSGSTGLPVPFQLSEKDLDRLAKSEAGSLSSAGITSNDVVQITTTMDKRFMAGLAYWLGLRRIGAGIIRSGPGNTAGQWETAERCGTTALITVPSFLLRMLEERALHVQDIRKTTIKRAICIGEPITDPNGGPNVLAKRIMALSDIALFGTYASTEMATACTETKPFGGHVVPNDLIIIEVLDENDQPVADGGIGEVIATPLGVEAMPLLRFRTGDICSHRIILTADGSEKRVLGPVIGRKGQRLKVKGTTVYPQQIVDAMNNAAGVRSFVILRELDENSQDVVRVLLEAPQESLELVGTLLSDTLRVKPLLEIADRKTIEKLRNDPRNRKPTPFIDNTHKPKP